MAQVKERGGGGEETPLPSLILLAVDLFLARSPKIPFPGPFLLRNQTETPAAQASRKMTNRVSTFQPWTWERGNFPNVGKPLGKSEAPGSLRAPSSTQTCELQGSARYF